MIEEESKYRQGLLENPTNHTTKRIFVAGTRMNEGKTTTCLGLFSALQKVNHNIGFIKPIGQRFVHVGGNMIDEDTVLFNSTYHISAPIEAMSPVAIDPTLTRRFLDNPDEYKPQLIDRMCRGFDRAAFEKDYIIIEGSGHAGVGTVFDMSNAQVAKRLGAKVIIVSTGGIGRPVDEIAMNRALFQAHGVEVIGAILNKVLPDKMDFIREYGGKGLGRLGIDLLGVIPMVKELTAPNMSQIVEAIGGKWINGEARGKYARVLNVVIGAMTPKAITEYFETGVLVVIPGDWEDIIFSALSSEQFAERIAGVTGLILTRDVSSNSRMKEFLKATDLPVIMCEDESYSIASKISNMTVKTQPGDADKIPLIQEAIIDGIDVDKIFQAFES